MDPFRAPVRTVKTRSNVRSSMENLFVERRIGGDFEIRLRSSWGKNFRGALDKKEAVRLMKWLREAIAENVACLDRCQEGCSGILCHCGCHGVRALV